MRILVIGLGLMGASLGAAARRAGHTVVGRDIDPGREAEAERLGAIDAACPEGEDQGVDLVALAAPPRAVVALIGSMPKGTLVTDLASVKTPVVRRAEEEGVRLVGGHPLAGTEGSGPADADPDLFRHRPYFLVPASTADDADVRLVEGLVRDVGAVPVTTSAERHDREVALTSHLLWALSRGLSRAADGLSEVARQGPAWEAFSRPGRSPEGLWREILDLNRDAVAGAWREVAARVEEEISHRGDD